MTNCSRWQLCTFAASVIFLLLISACTRVQEVRGTGGASSDFSVFIPPNAETYDPPANEKILLGEPKAQTLPTYPHALIAEGIAQRRVCLEIEIDEHGVVYHSRPLFGMLNCPRSAADVEPEFLSAAREAAMHWRFHPAVVCIFPVGTDADSKGNHCVAEGAEDDLNYEVRPIPIKLAFVFTFTNSSSGVPAVHARTMAH